ncbi:hypothetical protein [Bartonella grahamii]|nr:hypothetical protein [Bartonella grahamii]
MLCVPLGLVGLLLWCEMVVRELGGCICEWRVSWDEEGWCVDERGKKV